MRTRTRISRNLVSHNTAERSSISPAEKCRRGINKLEKAVSRALADGYEVTNIKVKKLQHTSEPKVVVKLFGEYIEVTAEMAERCNFKIEIL